MSDVKIVHFDDIGYSASCDIREHYATFIVYGIARYLQPENLRSYEKETGGGFTENISEAHSDLSGSIKWDGCSNWNMMPDEARLHFCSREDAINLGVLLGRLYNIAKAEIPRADF